MNIARKYRKLLLFNNMDFTKCDCPTNQVRCTCPWDGEKVWKKKASLSWASFLARNVFYRKWFKENDNDFPSSHAGPFRPPLTTLSRCGGRGEQ